MAVRRALISVFDKTGIVEFAKRLAALKIEILSTGGTAKLLRETGIAVRDVSDFTGWPEMLGGRVKTLHPKVHGGLLYRRGHAEDQKQVAEHGIAPIDLLVVNLYPFEATAAKTGLTAGELIENIDIGGPTMLRSAAKNFESVTVVTDPADFERVASEIESAGDTTLATRLGLAGKVFATTSRYDGVITTELERLSAGTGHVTLEAKPALPERVHIALGRQQELRYGENPHQAAALYVPEGRAPEGLAAAKQLQLKRILGGMLVQQPDLGEIQEHELRTVTKRAPTAQEMHTMRFAWKVSKHVKSNAIVFAKDGATMGVGAGQMSRVDSVKLAVMKAQSSLAGTVVASDAFFPFPDGVEEAAKAGATAVIQPGGSLRDADVVAAADRLGLAMVFTGMRHFLH